MSSPSEFLTFYRRMPATLKRARALPRPPHAIRAITYTAVRSDTGEDKKHVLDKGNRLDVQSDASHAGRESKAKGEGSQSMTEKDDSGSVDKAKKEHPEAPDAAIGFQDERGGKGH